MSVQSYAVDILLIALVLRQLRIRPLTARSALLPLGLIAWAWIEFFQRFAPNGADVVLIIVFALIGAMLGILSGTSTRVWHDDARLVCQADALAATAWIVGMGFRLVFEIWANSASGEDHIARFSVAHGVNSGAAWVSALLLMAVAQVVTRVGILQWRRYQADRDTPSVVAAADDAELG